MAYPLFYVRPLLGSLVPDEPSAFFGDFQFVDGSEYNQVGNASFFQLFEPGETNGHVFYAAVGTAVQPATGFTGSPTFHAINVTGLFADEVYAAFMQAVVNTGKWSVPGFSVVLDPILWQAQTLKFNLPLTIGGPGSFFSQKIRNWSLVNLDIAKVVLYCHTTYGEVTMGMTLCENADGSGALYGTAAPITNNATGLLEFVFPAGCTLTPGTHFHFRATSSGTVGVFAGHTGTFDGQTPYQNGLPYNLNLDGNTNPGGVGGADAWFQLYATPNATTFLEPDEFTFEFDSDSLGAVGSSVTTITDGSTSGNNPTQATAGSRGTVQDGPNTYKTLRFDGVDDFYTLPAHLDASGDFSWFEVKKRSAVGQKAVVLGCAASTDGPYSPAEWTDNNCYVEGGSEQLSFPNGGGATHTVWSVRVQSGILSMWKNGAQVDASLKQPVTIPGYFDTIGALLNLAGGAGYASMDWTYGRFYPGVMRLDDHLSKDAALLAKYAITP